MVAVVAGFTALSFQFSTSVRKKHKSFKIAPKPAIIGLLYVCVRNAFQTHRLKGKGFFAEKQATR